MSIILHRYRQSWISALAEWIGVGLNLPTQEPQPPQPIAPTVPYAPLPTFARAGNATAREVMARHRLRTEELHLVQAHQQSGLGVSEFTRRNGLEVASLRLWRAEFAAATAVDDAPQFVAPSTAQVALMTLEVCRHRRETDPPHRSETDPPGGRSSFAPSAALCRRNGGLRTANRRRSHRPSPMTVWRSRVQVRPNRPIWRAFCVLTRPNGASTLSSRWTGAGYERSRCKRRRPMADGGSLRDLRAVELGISAEFVHGYSPRITTSRWSVRSRSADFVNRAESYWACDRPIR